MPSVCRRSLRERTRSFAERTTIFARLARCGLALLLTVAMTAPAPAGERPLQWAADAEGGAPYIFKDPQNLDRNLGFEVDLAAALAKELQRPIEFLQYEYTSLDIGLNKGDFDFAMNGLEITPDRAAKFRFSRPYYIYEQQLVVRADDDRIRSLDDLQKLAGAEVGTLRDTAAERLLNRRGIAVRSYDGQAEPYVDLERRQIDAVLLDYPIALYYAKSNPKLKFVGERLAPGYYGIMFRKEDEALASEVDSALARLIESGALKTILEKWKIWTPKQDELATDSALRELAEAREGMPFHEYFKALRRGAKVTIQVSVVSMLLAIAIGLPIALMRLYGPWPVRWLAVGYVEFFRGIPVLLLLFFLYYGLPSVAQSLGLPFAVQLPAWWAAVLGFALNYAAYEAEIYRACISAIPRGQWEAAASLGMSGPLTFRRIILPQAVRTMIPPMTNDFVALFKDTSVISVITVVELTKEYQLAAKSSLKYAEIGLVTAALYLIMSVPLGYLSRYLEQRWSPAG